MDNRYLVVIVLVLGVLVGSAVTNFATPSMVVADDTADVDDGDGDNNSNRLHVAGSGEVNVDPDQVVISLGVSITKDSAEEAREECANRTSQVIDALKDVGITDDQVETERFSLYADRDYIREEDRSKVVGYRAVNTIKITSNDTDKAADLIDTAVQKGANDVDRVTFTLQDSTREGMREEAVKKAVQDAKTEAQHVAQEVGVQLGSPVKIDVTSTGYQPYQPRYSMASETPVPVATPAPTAAGPTTPIQEGKVTVTADIHIIYNYT
ncbi:MAG: SIMPL domain-containing protein [Archaeoglobaceae archaeon]